MAGYNQTERRGYTNFFAAGYVGGNYFCEVTSWLSMNWLRGWLFPSMVFTSLA